MATTLHLKSSYTSKDIKYIRNDIIVEYDMKSAGLNILTELGYFTMEDRAKLLAMDKKDRNVVIGKILKKNPEMIKDLEQGFAEARRIFIEKNGLDSYDILSIKRDAIYVIGSKVISTDITDLIKIYPKNRYTTYINLMGYEHYYNTDSDVLDVKKYTKEVTDIHETALFKDLKEILRLDQRNDKVAIFKKLAVLKDRLLTYNLPKEYYFDLIRSSYLFKADTYTYYTLPDINDTDVNFKVLSYANNLRFIHEVINLLL